MVSFGSRRLRLRGHVAAVSASLDGRRVAASCTGLDEIVVFELPKGDVVFRARQPADGVALSHDGHLLVTAFARVDVFDVDRGTKREIAGLEGLKRPMAFCSRTGLVAAMREDAIDVVGVNVHDDAEARVLHTAPSKVEDVALSEDGAWLAVARANGLVTLVALRDGTTHEIRIKNPYRTSVAFSPDGRTLAISEEEVVSLSPVPPTGARRRLPDLGGAADMVFSRDGRRLAVHASGQIHVVDLATGTPSWTRDLPFSEPATLFLDDDTLAVGAQSSVLLLRAATGERVEPDDGPIDSIRGLAVSPSGDTVVTGSMDRGVVLWERASGRRIARLGGHESYVWCAAFSPDGRLVATGGADRKIHLFDAAAIATEPRATIDIGDEVKSVAFSPDGATIAAVTEHGAIVVVDTRGHALRTGLPAGEQSEYGALDLAFVGDRVVAAARPGEEIVVVDLDSGKVERSFPGARGQLTANLRCGRFAYATEHAVEVLSLPDFTPIATLAAHLAVAIAIANSGAVAIGAFNGPVCWFAPGDVEGALLLEADEAAVTALAVDADGLLLVGTTFGETTVVDPRSARAKTPATPEAEAPPPSPTPVVDDDRTRALAALLDAYHRSVVSAGYRGAPASVARLEVTVPVEGGAARIRGAIEGNDVVLSIAIGDEPAAPDTPLARARRWIAARLSAEGRRHDAADAAFVAAAPAPPALVGMQVRRHGDAWILRVVAREVPPLEWLSQVVAHLPTTSQR